MYTLDCGQSSTVQKMKIIGTEISDFKIHLAYNIVLLFAVDIALNNRIKSFYGAFINGGILFQKLPLESELE